MAKCRQTADGDVSAFGKWFHGPGWTNVLKPGRVLDPMAPLRENFTGYAVPQYLTLGEVQAYYVEGQPSAAAPRRPVSAETMERGYPVSGDWTRRRQMADEVTNGVIPDRKPLGALF